MFHVVYLCMVIFQWPASDFSVLRNADIIEHQLPAVLACLQYWLHMTLIHCMLLYHVLEPSDLDL